MLERDLGFVETAPVRIEASEVIDAPRQAVWDVVADHRGWTSWFGPSLVRCEPTSEAESGVGSTRVVALRGGAEVHERFIAWDEPELWAFTGYAMKPAAFEELVERIQIAPLGDHHCRITYTMALKPARWLKPAVPLLRRGVGKSLQGALRSLKAKVEQSASPAQS